LLRNGLDPKAAEAICRQASRDPEQALGIYSRAVLGVNLAELGSPWASALFSLVMFAAGAFVPLAPWLIATGPKVAPISFVLGLGAAAVIGGVLGWQTRRHVLWSAMRQVFVVSLASGLTFLVGWLLGDCGVLGGAAKWNGPGRLFPAHLNRTPATRYRAEAALSTCFFILSAMRAALYDDPLPDIWIARRLALTARRID
jgi:VIT family protein